MSTHNSGTFQNKYQKGISHIPAKDLAKLFELADQLRLAVAADDQAKIKSFESSKQFLFVLLEYLIENMDSMNIDTGLVLFLQKFLGVEMEKDNLELEEEKWDELDEKEKKRRLNIWIYEIYKITNPNRLAGETSLDNFINNVKTRGIKVALEYDGGSFAKKFEKEDLANLESHKQGFVDSLKKGGVRGGGLGM